MTGLRYVVINRYVKEKSMTALPSSGSRLPGAQQVEVTTEEVLRAESWHTIDETKSVLQPIS